MDTHWIHVAKTSALRVRIDPVLHKEFLMACQRKDVAASWVLRDYMRQYVEKNKLDSQLELFNLEKEKQ